jgi:hypothetical protein
VDAPDDDATIRRVERERRRREDELLLILLLLLWQVERDASMAAVHGFDASQVIRTMLAGNGVTGHRGAAPRIARAMAQAHRDGYRRAGLMAGTTSIARADAGPLQELALLYGAHAQAMADAMASTLANAVSAAVAEARFNGAGLSGLRRAVHDTFDKRGYTRANSYGVEQGVERAIVAAHNGGILMGARDIPDLLPSLLVSLRHRSVLDNRTTEICTERNGLTLPANDVYWYTGGVPPLHPGCRSVLQVLVGDFKASAWRPMVPPMQGWGQAPLGMIETLVP